MIRFGSVRFDWPQINPARLELGDEKQTQDRVESNSAKLMMLVGNLLTSLEHNVSSCPTFFRHILARIQRAVSDKFPGMSVVGPLFFLRYFCPALVSPDQYLITSTCDIALHQETDRLREQSR